MMTVNTAGLALIKAYEGFRAKAYLDAVGVLTIGFGHTSMAGEPIVKRGMVISRAEAEAILVRDVARFAMQVATRVRVDLNDNQFSTLVSFAYNVGVGNLEKSSVLKAVNARDFDAVPRRLALWVKAGGRTLAGLVKRRASEGQLFMRPYGGLAVFDDVMALPTDEERAEMQEERGLIDAMEGPPLSQSTTVWASIGGWLSSVGVFASALQEEARKAVWKVQEWYFLVPMEHYGKLMLLTVATACLVWIIRERRRRARDDAV